MDSKKGNLKSWILFIVVVALVFVIINYLKDASDIQKTIDKTESGKSTKGFTTEELTLKDRTNLDNKSLSNALTSGNIKDCEKIQYNEELKKQCFDNINYVRSIQSGNENQCKVIADEKLKIKCYDKVYFSSATDTLSLPLCEKITNEMIKKNCINQIKSVMGRTAKSEKDCESITDSGLKQKCIDNYYFAYSIKELKDENCNNITDTRLKERCGNAISQNLKVIEATKKATVKTAKTTSEILKGCSALSGAEAKECKDGANYKLAFEEKDITYCNRLSNSSMKQSCVKEQTENLDQFYLRQAMSSQNKSLCEKIDNSALQILCADAL